jgi:hypothetical protein
LLAADEDAKLKRDAERVGVVAAGEGSASTAAAAAVAPPAPHMLSAIMWRVWRAVCSVTAAMAARVWTPRRIAVATLRSASRTTVVVFRAQARHPLYS